MLNEIESPLAVPASSSPSSTEELYLSLVVPLFNEEDSLEELVQQITETMRPISDAWEILFVDDGSTDRSSDRILELRTRDPRVKLIRFRRNYGKSAALAVGFEHASGAYVITMDADLQDDPREIPRLIAAIDSGYDMVSGWKRKRYDPFSKTIPSRFFNFVTSKMSGIPIHDFNCGLKGYKREVVKSVHVYGEMHRYIPVLAKMTGFSCTEIVVQHHPRKHGKTKFGMSRFFKGFLDLLTVIFTSRYTQRPLHVFGTVGAFMLFTGLLINLWLTVEWLLGHPVSNRPILLLGILLMLVGVQLISTGLLAEMVAKRDDSTTEYTIREKHF